MYLKTNLMEKGITATNSPIMIMGYYKSPEIYQKFNLGGRLKFNFSSSQDPNFKFYRLKNFYWQTLCVGLLPIGASFCFWYYLSQ